MDLPFTCMNLFVSNFFDVSYLFHTLKTVLDIIILTLRCTSVFNTIYVLVFCGAAIKYFCNILNRDQSMKFSSIQIFKYLNFQIFKFLVIQIFEYLNLQICKSSNIQIFKCSNFKYLIEYLILF